jgi:hypothetical protein
MSLASLIVCANRIKAYIDKLHFTLMKYVYPICSLTDHAMPFSDIHVFHTHVRIARAYLLIIYNKHKLINGVDSQGRHVQAALGP